MLLWSQTVSSCHRFADTISLFSSTGCVPGSIVMFANNSSEFPFGAEQNGTCLLPIDFKAMRITYASIYSVLLIASLAGNSLLIFASLKSNITMNLLITNIATSDLLYSIVHFPREIVAQIKGSTAFLVHGRIGDIFCKICNFTSDVTIAVSTLSLVLITADRMAAVIFPNQHRRITVMKRRFLIFSTWILSMIIHSPYFYTFRLDTIDGETFCITNWEPAFNHESAHAGYYTALLVTVLIVPLITVCILQSTILLKLRNNKMESFLSSSASQRRKKKNKNLQKMSIVISLAFALCWIPFIAYQFLLLFFRSSIPQCSLSFRIFGQFVFLFSLCHCIANPCICFTFMHRIRSGLKLRWPMGQSSWPETVLWHLKGKLSSLYQNSAKIKVS